MNGVIKNCLIKVCQHTGLNWVEGLPPALMACLSSELQMAPFELAGGRCVTTPSLHTSGKGLSLSLWENDMKAYVKYMSNLQRRISAYITQKQEQEEKEEEGVKWVVTILPRDKVLVNAFRRKWFDLRREGPFEVVCRTGTGI